MQINHKVEGVGEFIIMVHGWGGSIKSLEKLAQIAKKKYKVVILDLPGFGRSKSPKSDWGVGEYAQKIDDLLEELNIKSCIYFGHSFGGSLGIELASKNNKKIKKLILCNSAYKRTGKSSKKSKIIGLLIKMLPIGKNIKKKIRMFFYKIFFRHSDIWKYPELEENFRKITQQDLSPLLEKIKIPTLILWGEEDTYTPVSYAHELKEKIKNSKIKIFQKIGHNLPIKYPELVWKEIELFDIMKQ